MLRPFFHRAEVKVADGDNHEYVEIALKAEGFLIPSHCPFERAHGINASILVALFDKNSEGDIAPGSCCEMIFNNSKIPGHQRK